MTRLRRWFIDKRIRLLHRERHRLLDAKFDGTGKARDALRYRVVTAKIDVLEAEEHGYAAGPADEWMWER
jgi:hypothetical protein